MFKSFNSITNLSSTKWVLLNSRVCFSTSGFKGFSQNNWKDKKVLLRVPKFWERTQSTKYSTVSEKLNEKVIENLDPNLSSLGLAGWNPKGLVENGLEFLHCTLDVPWWSAIVIGTVCLRLAIFPLVILAQRNAANLNNNMPTLQRLQQRMTQARMSGDVQQAMESSKQMMEFMKVNKVNPLKNLLVPLAQIPIFLSVFTAIREMANLPVASWKSGGILWFTDLTIPDPFYILPVVTAATLFATIELGVDGIKADQIGSSTIKFVLRSMPFITFPIMIQFPSAMLCYWFTSNTFSLLQVLILKIPKVKSLCKIPPLIDHTAAYPLKEIKVPKQTFAEGFKQSMKNMEITYKLAEQQKLNEIKMNRTKTKSVEKHR